MTAKCPGSATKRLPYRRKLDRRKLNAGPGESLRRDCGLLLLRRCPWGLDELRQVAAALAQALAVHRLELGLREGMGRGALHQRVGPGLEARVFRHDADLLDMVEEDVALQERRIGRVDEGIRRAIEE